MGRAPCSRPGGVNQQRCTSTTARREAQPSNTPPNPLRALIQGCPRLLQDLAAGQSLPCNSALSEFRRVVMDWCVERLGIPLAGLAGCCSQGEQQGYRPSPTGQPARQRAGFGAACPGWAQGGPCALLVCLSRGRP